MVIFVSNLEDHAQGKLTQAEQNGPGRKGPEFYFTLLLFFKHSFIYLHIGHTLWHSESRPEIKHVPLALGMQGLKIGPQGKSQGSAF